MNISDSIQKFKDKLIINNDCDLAAIFRTVLKPDGSSMYVPYKVVSGHYDSEKKCFIADDNTIYYHMIDIMNGEGYMYRANIDIYRKAFPNVPDVLIKKLFLLQLKKLEFNLTKSSEDIPVILFSKKGEAAGENNKAVLDLEILSFYEEEYPELYNKIIAAINGDEVDISELSKEDTAEEVVIESPNIEELYNDVTSSVIDQDEPIKKILTAIWKQYGDFNSDKSRNILINGNTGVGKTEIFRVLSKKLNVPCAIVNATEYTAEGYVGRNIKDMLSILLKKANGNVKLAEKGILIIDEIDKLAQSNENASQINQKDVQEALLKLLEDGTYYIDYNDNGSTKKVEFCTKSLMVVGMGSFSRIKLNHAPVAGFESKNTTKKYKDITREDMIRNGMLPELIGRFPIIVQMNDLNKDSFIRILSNPKTSAITKNAEFFQSQGIKLSVSDDTLVAIAELAEKQALGARSLDEIVETSLSSASFEIAMHPDMYDELIISPETIKDNNMYTLKEKNKCKVLSKHL